MAGSMHGEAGFGCFGHGGPSVLDGKETGASSRKMRGQEKRGARGPEVIHPLH
jgi:hypothetical protein